MRTRAAGCEVEYSAGAIPAATAVRTGICQFNLSVGTHPYKVEAPFHEEVVDSFELSDTARLIVPVALKPFYSYLTVKTPLDEGRIMVDGQWIGNHEATSGHLLEGKGAYPLFQSEEHWTWRMPKGAPNT